MTDVDKYQLAYVGSRPVAKNGKEIAGLEKITTNLKNMFGEIVKETSKKRRRLIKYLFGGQSFCLRIHLYYIDYLGMYFRLLKIYVYKKVLII